MRIDVIAVLVAARRRARRERGAMALMTLCFLVAVGLVCVLTLLSIGYATGAYNTLYTATQAAAFAAAGQTQGNGAQMTIDCSGINGNWCTSGTALTAAEDTLGANLAPCAGEATKNCHFGIVYAPSGGGTVQLTKPGQAGTGIAVYNLTVGAGQVLPGSSSCSGGGGGGTEFFCDPVTNTTVYDSGVIVYTQATIHPPACPPALCNFTVKSEAVATLGQDTATGSFSGS